MLVAQALPELMGQALTGGVHTALLLQMDGSILGSKTITAAAGEELANAHVVTAIEAVALWHNYTGVTAPIAGDKGAAEQKLRCCIVECEGRTLCLMPVSKLLLCLLADLDVPLGMLRKKANVLADHLTEPFDGLFSQLGPSYGADPDAWAASTR
eukprot:TRINITY_DN5303_c0_g1_i1.p1 TRINITY_DN5303_c0_g1~~TRINITY_DN5303_c0_g1_i1.p1  ORF type:complete len:155 (+),score=33.52 TRINITY_DN5303_c0_g1_i1:61-525(+)